MTIIRYLTILGSHNAHLWQQRWQTFEEEIFDSSGDSIDSNVQTVNVEAGVFIKLGEQQVYMSSVARDSVQSLCCHSLTLNILNTATQEHWDRIFITGPGKDRKVEDHERETVSKLYLKSSMQG